MYDRTIICLANSRKPPSGRCIAGKELGGGSAGQWLRPVSARETREVSEEERRYESGEKAQLLDIICVPLNSHSPLGHQTENHILADDYYWTKLGTATLDQVNAQIDQYDANFWVQAESTYHGAPRQSFRAGRGGYYQFTQVNRSNQFADSSSHRSGVRGKTIAKARTSKF